jgi:hypothetical protein
MSGEKNFTVTISLDFDGGKMVQHSKTFDLGLYLDDAASNTTDADVSVLMRACSLSFSLSLSVSLPLSLSLSNTHTHTHASTTPTITPA